MPCNRSESPLSALGDRCKNPVNKPFDFEHGRGFAGVQVMEVFFILFDWNYRGYYRKGYDEYEI